MRLTRLHLFSLIWTSFGPCDAIVQPPMILRQDNLKVIERNEKIMELEPMISCVEKIAVEWFIGKESVTLLIPNFLENPGLSKPFFTKLQNGVATLSVAEDFSSSENYRISDSAVILVRNATDLHLLKDTNQLCAPRCKYVVCLLTFYQDEASLLAEADAVVKAMWRTWIINLVIIASVAGRFVVAGSYSFESNVYKVPKKPEILGECGTLMSKRNNKYIFHKLLMNNCRVNITVGNCPPYVQLVEKNGEQVFTGIEGDLFETIAKGLDISLNRLIINPSKGTNSSFYEILLHVLDDPEETDVVFCGLYWGNSAGVEYSVTFDRQEIVWLVPSLPALSFLGLVTPLQNLVWFAIIGLFLFAGITKVLFFRKLSFLGVLGLILGVAQPQQPKRLSNRIQFGSWVIFGYVVTQSYLASLAGQLMNTNYEMIETMEQLESSGIIVGGTARHRNLFKDDENPVSHRIYQRYQILAVEEYDAVMADVLAGKNNSMALVDEIETSHTIVHTGSNGPHRLHETLANYPISFAVWQGLPYLDQINEKVAWLNEAGLINYWSEKYVKMLPSSVEITISGELEMLHLSPSFLLLLLGHGLSIVAFFVEIGIYTRKNHVRLKCKNKLNKKERNKCILI